MHAILPKKNVLTIYTYKCPYRHNTSIENRFLLDLGFTPASQGHAASRFIRIPKAREVSEG